MTVRLVLIALRQVLRLLLAIANRGIEITDQGALDDFVDEVNRNGGIDVLADSLASSQRLRR